MSRSRHIGRHLVGRVGWLRAAVLGANDGIVSTASLIVGLAILGGVGAKAGGGAMLKPVLRMTLWRILAIAITAGIGRLFGAVL